MRAPTLVAPPVGPLVALVVGLVVSLAACGPKGLKVPELGPVPALPEWPEDPPTPEKVALGEALYRDPRLSGSGRTSCDSCHLVNTSFQDNLPLPTPDSSYPLDQPKVARHTPSMLNLVYAPVFRWDGAMDSLVEVMAFPFGEANMNLGRDLPQSQAALFARLTQAAPEYLARFQEAYGVDLRTLQPAEVWVLAGRALAAYARTAVSRDAPFDRWNAGDDDAMSAAAVRGLELFRGEARCIPCHSGPFFSDFDFHNLSLELPRADGSRADEGRFLVTHREEDRGKFLTPTLRGAWDTAPYFHDGSADRLLDVVAHFGSPKVRADPNHDALVDEPLSLTKDQMDDLVAFMKALRGAR